MNKFNTLIKLHNDQYRLHFQEWDQEDSEYRLYYFEDFETLEQAQDKAKQLQE